MLNGSAQRIFQLHTPRRGLIGLLLPWQLNNKIQSVNWDWRPVFTGYQRYWDPHAKRDKTETSEQFVSTLQPRRTKTSFNKQPKIENPTFGLPEMSKKIGVALTVKAEHLTDLRFCSKKQGGSGLMQKCGNVGVRWTDWQWNAKSGCRRKYCKRDFYLILSKKQYKNEYAWSQKRSQMKH